MNTMSAVEFDLLDELYFITAFKGLPQAIGQSDAITRETLCSLLRKEFVWQFYFDTEANDFVRTNPIDPDHPEQYHYLASKKGLLAHNI